MGGITAVHFPSDVHVAFTYVCVNQMSNPNWGLTHGSTLYIVCNRSVTYYTSTTIGFK